MNKAENMLTYELNMIYEELSLDYREDDIIDVLFAIRDIREDLHANIVGRQELICDAEMKDSIIKELNEKLRLTTRTMA